MDFKKNSIGVVITFFLVILLSQSRFFDFLINTPLGRIILLAFVILIAYTNKIIGLVAVLFIIIAFNGNDINTVYSYNYFEGFDGSGNSVSQNITKDKIDILKSKEDILKNKLAVLKTSQQNPSQTTTTTSSVAATPSTTTSGAESFKNKNKGVEGFCMTDRETNILRGKQSNTIPVFNNSRTQTDDVSPSDKSVFTNEFASF